MSEAYRDMLIVAGTCYEELGVRQESRRLFNTAFVYKASSLLASCSKRDTSTDSEYAALCELEQGEVEEGGTAFNFEGIRCLLQICTDTKYEPLKPYDLSIVPAYQPGKAATNYQEKYLYRILSDGAGFYYIYDGTLDEPNLTERGPGPFKHIALTFGDDVKGEPEV